MERRNFIQMLVAGGVLSAAPMAANALSGHLAASTVRPVTVMGQSGMPQAAELLAQLHQVLGTAGLAAKRVMVPGTDLLDFGAVSAWLDRAAGGHLIGVMDDARALLFQQIAAARGLNCLLSTHHRYAQRQARHCCTANSLGPDVAAAASVDTPDQQIGRLYASTAQAPAALRRWASPPASLVSFLIQA